MQTVIPKQINKDLNQNDRQASDKMNKSFMHNNLTYTFFNLNKEEIETKVVSLLRDQCL